MTMLAFLPISHRFNLQEKARPDSNKPTVQQCQKSDHPLQCRDRENRSTRSFSASSEQQLNSFYMYLGKYIQYISDRFQCQKHACYFSEVLNMIFINPDIYWLRMSETDLAMP